MSRPDRARNAFFATVSACALLTASAAAAQQVQSPEEAASRTSPGGIPEVAPRGLPEIVVTAQRRAESLQDVPVAVSAFSNEALADQQINNSLNLQQALPNTTFTKGNFTGDNITIRGIGSASVATSGDAGVGVHFNDVPLVSGGLFETEFFDIERIEVLRGPQGTLFGRNATGGVVNLITAKPTFEFESAGEFEYGNFDSKTARGMVNVPLGDIAAVRLAGIYLNRDGFTENLNTGNRIDGRDYYALRGTVMFEPTDRTTAYVTAQYRKEDSNRSRIQKQLCSTDTSGILGCRPDQLGFDTINGRSSLATVLTSEEFLTIAASPALANFAAGSVYGDDGYSGAVNPTDFRKVAIDFEPTYKSEGLIIQGELEHEFDNFTVTLNGGYTDGSIDTRTDYNLATTDPATALIGKLNAFAGGAFGAQAAAIAGGLLSTPLFQNGQICVSEADTDLVGFIGGKINRCADNTTEYDRSAAKSTQWSVEGRVASDFDGPFNFQLGGLYLNYKVRDSDYFVVASLLDYAGLLLGGPASGFQAALGPSFYDSNTDRYTLDSYGIFGELYYDITDELKITGGLRWSKDEKYVRDRQFLVNVPVPFGTDSLTDEFFAGSGFDADPGLDGNQVFREQTAKFDEFTGRVVIDWNPVTSFSDSTLVYASYSRGYKPGGINPPFDPAAFPDTPAAFEPEFINAFEVGTKNVFGGGVAAINLTGFYYDYKDFQVSRIVNRTSFNDNTDAEVYGLELETLLSPIDAMTFNATISYQKTKIKDLQLVDTRDPSGGRSDAVIIKDITNASNCVFTTAQAGTLDQATLGALVAGFNQGLSNAVTEGDNPNLLRAPVAVDGTNALGAYSICGQLAAAAASGAFGAASDLIDVDFLGDGTPVLPSGVEYDLSGNQLINSPNWKVSVGAQYAIETAGGWTITPRVDANLTGDFFASNFNRPVDKVPSYVLVNAQLTVNSPDDRFYVRGFVQNAFDTTAQTGRYITDQSSGLFTNIFLTDPRRYGAAVGFRF